MKDTCAVKQNLIGDVTVPCKEIHDPHPLDEDSVETLRKLCPTLFLRDDNPLFCCSTDQVTELADSMGYALQMGLSRCPSCSYNWRASLCEFTCSSSQADFIKIVNTTTVSVENEATGTNESREQIDEIEFHMDAEYPEELFKSCEKVQGLAGHKMLKFMCGTWGDQCTGRRWLEYMGLSIDRNGNAPFQMTYIYHDSSDSSNGDDTKQIISSADGSTVNPLSIKTYSCSQRPTPKELPCGCNDCEETCQLSQLPPSAKWLPEKPQPIELFGITGAIASSISLFVFATGLILTYFSLKSYNRKRTRNRK